MTKPGPPGQRHHAGLRKLSRDNRHHTPDGPILLAENPQGGPMLMAGDNEVRFYRRRAACVEAVVSVSRWSGYGLVEACSRFRPTPGSAHLETALYKCMQGAVARRKMAIAVAEASNEHAGQISTQEQRRWVP